MFTNVELNKSLRLINHGPVVLVSSGRGDNISFMPAAWNMPVSHNPPLLAVAFGYDRYTLKLVHDTGDFVVNLPTSQQINEVMVSGSPNPERKDKFLLTGFHKSGSTLVSSPSISESLAHLECKYIKSHDLGDHELVIGEVVSADVRDGWFDDVWLRSPQSIHHLGSKYFCVTGERVSHQ